MSEPAKGPISRRDFLKIVGGLGLAALGTWAVGDTIGMYKDTTRGERLKPQGYKEVPEGGVLNLKLPGNEDFSEVKISYDFDTGEYSSTLKIRQENNQGVVLPFKNGRESVRMIGELIDLNVYKVIRNPELPDEKTIGVYKSAGPLPNLMHEERKEFPNDREMCAIKVITWGNDYLLDKNKLLPLEKNVGREKENLPYFGEGALVGTLEGDGIFNALGYVDDFRALEVFG